MSLRLPAFIYQIAYLLFSVYLRVFRLRVRGVLGFVECEGKILLVRHSYGGRQWTLPGGNMDDEESPEEAIKRELREEVGIELTALRRLNLMGDKGRKAPVVYFHGSTPSTQLKISSGEIQEAKWFAYNDMISLLPLKERYIIKKYLKNRRDWKQMDADILDLR